MNPETKHVKRSVRLVAMRDILRVRPVTVDEMAERFGVDKRTIYRDFAELQAEPLRVPLMCKQLWAVMEIMERLK